MVFCKNVLIQFSVKKHLSLSTVVTGSVPALVSDVTVKKKNCCELFLIGKFNQGVSPAVFL
jgi:hypothetical protein